MISSTKKKRQSNSNHSNFHLSKKYYIYCWEPETIEDVPSFPPFQVSMIFLLNKKEDTEVYLEHGIFP